MKKTLILSIAALSLAACSDSMTSPFAEPGDALFANNGNSNDRPAAMFDLSTPALSGSLAGQTVSLSWTPADLAADCAAAAAANLANEDITCWGVHFELYRNGVKIAEPTSASYTDSNLADGSYTYYVKSKGMEGTPGPSVYTHHSLDSNSQTYVVSSGCPAPAVTLGASSLTVSAGGGNSESVTFSGSTTNVIGCAGGAAQYMIGDSNPTGPGGDQGIGWTSLTVAANGSYSFSRDLRSNNVGRTYTVTVRVMNADNTSWTLSAPVVVTVTDNGNNGGNTSQGGRGSL